MIGVTIDEQVWEKFLRVTDEFWVPRVLRGADFMSAICRDFILRFWHLCAA